MDANSAPDMMQVMQYLDQFYTTSFNHLVICGSVAVGLVGVVIPILISIMQSRTMRHEREQIQKAIVGQVSVEVRDQVGKEKILIEEWIVGATKSLGEKLAQDRANLEEGMRKMKTELRKEIAAALGAVYHVQATSLLARGAHRAALSSAVDGIDKYLDGGERRNLRRLISIITKDCLPKIKKSQLDGSEEKEEFEAVISRIEKWDSGGNFTDAVRDAKRAFKAACERVPPAKPPEI